MTPTVQLFPSSKFVELFQLEEVMQEIEMERLNLKPFHPVVIEFCTDLARSLRKHPAVKSRPALAALAWWLRPGSMRQLEEHWSALSSSPDIVRVPRGIVFHIPPTNVETILVYSWIFSALAGNANVIRLSSSSSSDEQVLFDVIFESMRKFPLIEKTTCFVKYGHELEVTEILSQSDVRAIWGGNETVMAIRRTPSAPRSIDIPFANRFSFSVLSSDAIGAASDEEMSNLAHHFVNDAYWFDQMACSSPKLIFIAKSQQIQNEKPLRRFINCLVDELERKNVDIGPAVSMAKLVNSFSLAADGLVTNIHRPDHRITVGELVEMTAFPRDTPGGGLFYTLNIDDLNHLLPFIKRSDQTITQYGFTEVQLREFIGSLNGRGIDRIVPIGQALSFDVIWDGFDLFESFSKLVHLKIS
jgi:hypothetical protein